MIIAKSTRAGKRFMATFANGKVVHFGSAGGRTYIDHGDEAKRSAYIARHSKNNENWNNPYSPGALSKYIAWGESSDINKNIAAFMKKFGVS